MILQIGDGRCQEGITEMRGQKDLRKEAKKGPVRWEKRRLYDPGKGHIMGNGSERENG